MIKGKIFQSILRLDQWLEENHYKGYEPFDGLSSYLRPLTFHEKFPQQCLQQFVLRFPFNIRKYLGVSKKYSSKAMGFLASGYLRMYRAEKEDYYRNKSENCLNWLITNYSKGYSGLCWGNAFDYQSRNAYIPKDEPTVVWTSLIGHSLLDAYDILKIEKYKDAAFSSGNFILNDLSRSKDCCISYLPFMNICVHNSNMLAASFLARLYFLSKDEYYISIARKAMHYSISCQLDNGAWYYGEKANLHWIDSWHTAYNLDSLKHYMIYSGDRSFSDAFHRGVRFYLDYFFLYNGLPKYYWDRVHVVDIQSAGQALDSLIFYSAEFPEAIGLAKKVADWTICNMQDKSGYFYYRKYKYITNKTPMLHWGQSTIFSGLSRLYLHLKAQPELV